MVSTKCCAGIIIGVLVAVGVSVGIYFATAKSGSKSEKKDPQPDPSKPDPTKPNPFKNLQVLVKTKHSFMAYDLSRKEYHAVARVDEAPYGILSFDYHSNRTVYYATTEAGSPIKSAFPREHPTLPNYTDSWFKTGMTVDQLTGKIYVADRIEGKIYVVDVVGQHHKDLMTGLDQPLDIVLDHAKRNMFVLTKSSIFLATMSGVKDKELIKKSNLRAIAVDFTNDRLYYADGDKVVMYDVKTTQEKVVYTLEVTSLAVQDGKLFFISKKDKNLYECDDTTAPIVKCAGYPAPTGVEGFESIKTYGHLASLEGVTSPCNQDNGGCKHLCLLAPSDEGYVCDCDDGWKLDAGKKNCIESNPFKNIQVLVKTKHSIIAYDLVSRQYHNFARVDESLYGISSFDYHSNRAVYYATTETGSPIQSSIPQEHPTLPGYTSSWMKTGMTVDQLTGKIYVADRIEGKIYVVDVLGQHHKDLMTDLDEPLDIVLDHVKGNMFILTKSSILLATMSGVKDKELVKKSNLRAIAVDFTNDRLYYADGDKVVMYDVKTTQEKVVYTLEVTSLAVQDGKLFFISKKDKNLYECDDTTAPIVKCAGYPAPTGVESFESIKTYGHLASIEGATSPCKQNNGGCKHLCLLAPSEEGYICDCDDGWKLDADKMNCIQA